MNLRVVDEHGRQLGMGRNVAALKAELGTQARSAFQALAAIKTGAAPGSSQALASPATAAPAAPIPERARAARETGAEAAPAARRYTDWSFGELPELMEVPAQGRGGASLVGFPALIDHGTHVELEVAAVRHRAGLRRLVALQLKEPLKYLEKNIPELQRMGVAYMGLGTVEELRQQIVDVALERAFLAEPLPHDAPSFAARLAEGRARLNLIAQEIARQAATVLAELAAAQRKLKDSRPPKEVAEDVQAQLARLVPRRFVADTPPAQLAHLPRYLKGVQLRLDKLRADPQRDAARLAELRPLEQRWARLVAERRGAGDARLEEFRWLLEELRVGLFAQELKTPQPVSVKRLEKVWQQMAR